MGPESTSATVTWELNGRNFGAFLRNQGRSCAGTEVATGTSPQYDSCVSALQSYGSPAEQRQERRPTGFRAGLRQQLVVYANKDEFLGEVDHQLSINLGLKLRQPK